MSVTEIVRLGLLAFLASSCAARRLLTVTSDPPGAQVELDGQRIGTTPVEVEFQHYGVRQVTVALSGRTTWTKNVRIKSPWYGRFPFDVVSEILLPIGWVDRHTVHAVLEPQEGAVDDPQLQAVLARARALRATMESSEPVPPPQPPPEASAENKEPHATSEDGDHRR
jgi:hypothetical protein